MDERVGFGLASRHDPLQEEDAVFQFLACHMAPVVGRGGIGTLRTPSDSRVLQRGRRSHLVRICGRFLPG